MGQFVVFTIGRDRPGIVAAVTGALFEIGGNLLDTSMTVLSGHFAVALAVEASVSQEALEAALASLENHLDLDITVRPIDTGPGESGPGESGPESRWQVAARDEYQPDYVVSVYGADHPGIVASITSLLADRGINVVDLNTRRVGDPSDPVYAMLLEVRVDPEQVASLRAALAEAAKTLGVEASLHVADAEML